MVKRSWRHFLAILVIVVPGLLYLRISGAIASSSVLLANQAKFAPIFSSVRTGVINAPINNDAHLNTQEVFELRVSQREHWLTSLKIRLTSWYLDTPSRRGYFVDVLHLAQSIFASDHTNVTSDVDSWTPPVVLIRNIGSPEAGYEISPEYNGSRALLAWSASDPDIGTLVFRKVLSAVPNRRASELIGTKHGEQLEDVHYKDAQRTTYGNDLNPEFGVILPKFYEAHRFLLFLLSVIGLIWFSGRFLIYIGRYGPVDMGRCAFSLLLAFVFAAHAVFLLAFVGKGI